MFGVGFWELALIALAVLLFLRPSDLPGLLRKLGKLHGQYVSMSGRLTREFERGIREGQASTPERDSSAKPTEDIRR